MNDDTTDVRFQEGIGQFNRGQFFEAHETWEEIWLAAQEPERTFLQGIIQVAAAFHHYQRGNHTGAQSLVEAGLKKLDPFQPVYRGIQLDLLCASAKEWMRDLSEGRSPQLAQCPQIHAAK